MATYTSIHRSAVYRSQTELEEQALARTFRSSGFPKASIARRHATGRVRTIRHWQDGHFVALPLHA